MPDDTDAHIAAELDERHAEAHRAYKTQDIASYRRIFSPDLKYTQLDGKTIDLDRLMSDVRDQFSRVTDVGSKYERESMEIHEPDRVIETLAQTAWAEFRVLFFFKRRWGVQRRGQYTWKKTADGWHIADVVVLQETVS